MEPGLIWILAGIALLGAELFLSGLYLLWVGIAAIGTGILLLRSDAGFVAASLTFLLLLAGGVFASMSLQRSTSAAHGLNRPESGLVGRSATVVGTEGATLRVRVGDSDWPARLPGGTGMPPPGSEVRIEAVDGTVLVVRPEAAR